jgi:hypothetical protein
VFIGRLRGAWTPSAVPLFCFLFVIKILGETAFEIFQETCPAPTASATATKKAGRP